jgi:hypothetical protein
MLMDFAMEMGLMLGVVMADSFAPMILLKEQPKEVESNVRLTQLDKLAL